ncbi:MAG TPA: glycosyltransferase [Solirubrobacterales bacterium]|nr:glycosyltransferase [Solirubrobacterales bacterium]
MALPKFVQIPPHRLDRFEPLLGDGYARIEEAAQRARGVFAGRAIWHVSSTLRGGGVAEMLRSLLPYARGAGIDTRWVVLRERAEFFELTKRLHNNLHGDRGDGGPLGIEQRDLYTQTLAASARHLTPLVQPGDVVFLHDPQTAGLASALRAAGATVVWRCHIGADRPDEFVRRAWDFLRPEIEAAEAWIFSRRAYVWEGLDPARALVLAPSIDPLSPKNEDLDRGVVEKIVGVLGLGLGSPDGAPIYLRADGSPARVERRAEIVQESPLPDEATLVAQVSRWDRLKDHLGLLACFRRHLADRDDLHLLLAGPASAAVADDPEGPAVWREVGRAWRELPTEIRRRVHLVNLPMADLDENAAMVNALQRRADVVVQKSLAEGFGLTVAEAMWKRRPVVGTRVGGIQDQIVDGKSGLLVDDPRDLEGLARAISSLAEDRERAAAIGEQAHQRVFERFLAPTRLVEYAELLAGLGSKNPRR